MWSFCFLFCGCPLFAFTFFLVRTPRKVDFSKISQMFRTNLIFIFGVNSVLCPLDIVQYPVSATPMHIQVWITCGFRKIRFLPFLKEQKLNIRGALIEISLIPAVLNLKCIWRTQCTIQSLLLFQYAVMNLEIGKWKFVEGINVIFSHATLFWRTSE